MLPVRATYLSVAAAWQRWPAVGAEVLLAIGRSDCRLTPVDLTRHAPVGGQIARSELTSRADAGLGQRPSRDLLGCEGTCHSNESDIASRISELSRRTRRMASCNGVFLVTSGAEAARRRHAAKSLPR